MKHILKDSFAPDYLLDWVAEEKTVLEKKTSHKCKWKHFGKTEVKKRLRSQLLKEQGFICAYCNQRIHLKYQKDDLDTQYMSIEHIKPKSNPVFVNKIFDYYNLVGVCRPEKKRKNYKEDHCDVTKGSNILPEELNPTKRDFERIVQCGKSGKLSSAEGIIDRAINDILTLNCNHLKQGRKDIIDAIEYELSSMSKANMDDIALFEKQYFEDQLALFAEKEGGLYKAYSGAIILYIKDQLKNIQ
jgi:uncharacterized protein (TIGR02646 family)